MTEGPVKPILYMDDRELPARRDILRRRRVYQAEDARLPVADYVLGDYGFEFKSIPDITGDIRKDLWRKLDELVENYEKPFLVLEVDDWDASLMGNPKWRYNAKLRQAILSTTKSAIASILEKKRVSVLFVRDAHDFADWLVIFTKRMQRKGVKAPMGRVIATNKARDRLLSDEAEDALCALSGLGRSAGGAIMEHFGSLSAVASASPEELMEVPRIGKVLANHIHAVFHEEVTPK